MIIRDAKRRVRIIATARELDRPYGAVRNRRRKLGVQKRVEQRKMHHVRITCDQEFYDRVQTRALEQNRSVAGYIRELVRRDIGL